VRDRDSDPTAASVPGGLFIAFEGVEGSGKSTQSARLTAHLRGLGFDVVLAREPGSTPLGERVRGLVLDENGLSVPPRSELFLMLAARAAFVADIVDPALAMNRVVVADRFELSTLAYQGAGRGLPLDDLIRCNRVATGGLAPHVTFLLDLDPDEGVRRQLAAAKRPDRMEAEARDFHRRVAAGYHDLAGMVAGLLRIDASGTVEEVQERVLRSLAERYPETFAETGFIS
jgi:dTMP kinase